MPRTARRATRRSRRWRRLDALVERARAAGLPVELEVHGSRRELTAGLDLAAYRVLQEALTNVIKHGGGAATDVRVHYRADAVEVLVSDRGGGPVDARLAGSGHGLVGMRERVRMYGGELHAGRAARRRVRGRCGCRSRARRRRR